MHSPAMRLLSEGQRDFPLTERPFASMAQRHGLPEADVMRLYSDWLGNGTLSRVGAVFDQTAGGTSSLVAMEVPPDRLDEVAAVVSATEGVSHNYEREHRINLWFVLSAPDDAHFEQRLHHIEHTADLPALRLPMVQSFRIDLAFDIAHDQARHTPTANNGHARRQAAPPIAADDRTLAALAEQGLTVSDRPFDAWAQALGRPVSAVLKTLNEWLNSGAMRRFGHVVRHHELGYTANAMVVFDVPADQVEQVGQTLAAQPQVTLAYERQRHAHWPYNVYAMIHGRDREGVLQTLASMRGQPALAWLDHQVLFSCRRFKQVGGQRFHAAQPPHRPATVTAQAPQTALAYDHDDLRLIDHLHGGFGLVDRPFAATGQALGMSETEVIARLQRLLQDGVLTRFGPLFQIERANGKFVLAAMAVPEDRFDAVAAQVNARTEVAHNYRRTHALNMWFVVATESAELATACMQEIERQTGLKVYAFPKEREFHVELRLPLLNEKELCDANQ